MTAHDEAGAILAHSFRMLAQANGLRWTDANDADIQRVVTLLSRATSDMRSTIPPYQRRTETETAPRSQASPQPAARASHDPRDVSSAENRAAAAELRQAAQAHGFITTTLVKGGT